MDADRLTVAAAAGTAVAALLCFGTPASAQGARQVATPVAVVARTVNSEVQCRPRLALLPPRALLDFRVRNTARVAIRFIAPKFFQAAETIDTRGFVYDASLGGFIVAPRSTVAVTLRSPPAGRYYYSCHRLGRVPTLASSGFLEVKPAR